MPCRTSLRTPLDLNPHYRHHANLIVEWISTTVHPEVQRWGH